MSLLITRPRYEITTHYLFSWSVIIIQEAKHHHSVYDLSKNKAKKSIVESYIRKHHPDIMIFNGHGNENTIAGQDGEELISVGQNEALLQGSAIFMRACSAGASLGLRVMQSGAVGFIGYKDVFVFLHDKEKTTKPLNDELARPFLECSNEVAISLVRGNSVERAHENSMRAYKKKIDEMLTSKFATTHLLPFLYWNMINQVCYPK